MADESSSFSTARTRLEEIVTQVRKKDTSLDKSLELLEEGVRLANACTELIDHQDWASSSAAPEADATMTQDSDRSLEAGEVASDDASEAVAADASQDVAAPEVPSTDGEEEADGTADEG